MTGYSHDNSKLVSLERDRKGEGVGEKEGERGERDGETDRHRETAIGGREDRQAKSERTYFTYF